MRVRSLVRFELPFLLKEYKGTVAILASLTALLLSMQAIIGAAVSAYASQAREGSALTLIAVESLPQARAVDSEALEEISSLAYVRGVYPHAQYDLTLTRTFRNVEETIGPLWATPLAPYRDIPVVAGTFTGELGDGEIVIPARFNDVSLEALVGHSLSFTTTRVTSSHSGEPANITLKIVATFDDSGLVEDPPGTSYVNQHTFDTLLAVADAHIEEYGIAYVDVDHVDHVADVQRTLNALGFASRSITTQMNDIGGIFGVMEKMAWVLAILIIGAVWFAGGSFGGMWMRRRYRDVGLLRSLGWSARIIFSAIVAELSCLGLVVAAGGILVAVPLSMVCVQLLKHVGLSFLSYAGLGLPGLGPCLAVLIAVPAFFTLGGVPRARLAAQLSPDEVMRSA